MDKENKGVNNEGVDDTVRSISQKQDKKCVWRWGGGRGRYKDEHMIGQPINQSPSDSSAASAWHFSLNRGISPSTYTCNLFANVTAHCTFKGRGVGGRDRGIY